MQTDTRLRMLAPSCITVELQLGAASVLPQRDTWDTSAKVIFWSVIGDVRIVRSQGQSEYGGIHMPHGKDPSKLSKSSAVTLAS